MNEKINMGVLSVSAEMDATKFRAGAKQVEQQLDELSDKANSSFAKLSQPYKTEGGRLTGLKTAIKNVQSAYEELSKAAQKLGDNKGLKSKNFDSSLKNLLSTNKTKLSSLGISDYQNIKDPKILSNILKQYQSDYINLSKAFTKEIDNQANSFDKLEAKEQANHEKEMARLEKEMQKMQEAAEAAQYRSEVLERFKTIGTSTTANSFFQNAYADSIAKVTDETVREGVETRILNGVLAEEEQKIYKEITIRKKLAQIMEQNSTVAGKFKTVIQGINKVQDGVSNAFTKAISRLKSAAVTYRIIGGVIRQVWNQLKGMFEEAASYVESVNLYTIALGEYAEQGSKWANKISTALYLDPKDIMQYTGAFYNLVQGLGVAKDAAYTMSTSLTQLSYDMSSYLNIDVEAAHDKLQSAITGQSRAVASAGIAMQVASLQQLAYSMGIKKSVSEMTQAEKTYLRYIQIMRSTANMQGDLARTIVTPENAVRVLRNQFTLLARAIGNVFIPIIMKAIPYVMALTRILQDLATRIASFLGVKIGWSNSEIDYSGLKLADTYLEGVGDTAGSTAGKVGSAVKKIKDDLGNLASFDELNVITFNDDTTSGSGGTGGVGGVGGGGSVLPQLEEAVSGYDMLKGLTQQFDKQVDNATKNLDKFKTVLERIFAIFVAWKALKFAGDMIALVDKIKAGSTAMGGLGSVASLLYKTFKGGKGTLSDTAKEITNVTTQTKFGTKAWAEQLPILARVGMAVSGLITLLGSTALEYKNVKNQALDYMKTGKEMNGLIPTLGVAGSTAGGALIGTAIAPGIGTLIGGAIGAITGVTAAWNAADDALYRYNAELKLFGDLSINAEQWTSIFDNIFESSNRFTNSLSSLNSSINSHYDATQNAIDSLDLLSYKYGLTGTKISETDSKKIMSALETITTETTGMINDSTDKSLLLWKDTLDNMSGLSKQQQEKMLNRIVEYGDDQKSALKEAQDNITRTYDTAIKTRGYLTDQERVYIQTQLQKIRELTKQEMSKNQTEIEYYKTVFADRNKKLDMQSYKDFMEVYNNYAEEQRQQIQTNYNERLNDARRLSNGVKSVYEEYATAAKIQREDEQAALNRDLENIRYDVLSNIGETYVQLLNKTDENSVKIRQEIEGIFKELNIDTSEVIQKFGSAGKQMANKTVYEFDEEWKRKQTVFHFQIGADTTGAAKTVNDYMSQLQKKSMFKNMDLTPINGGKTVYKLKADGGYLNSGDFFFANENGIPEYITSIGNKSAVVNQQQMVTALTNAIVEGLSNMNTPQSNEPVNIYIGNDKVYSGFINYAKRQNNIYGTNVIRI